MPDRAGTGTGVEEAVGGALDVRAASRRVPPRQRAVLVPRFYEELTVAETAAALRTSQGTVKSQCARGLLALQAALDPPAEPVGTSGPAPNGPARTTCGAPNG